MREILFLFFIAIKPAISFIFPFTSNVAQIIQYGISDAPADKSKLTLIFQCDRSNISLISIDSLHSEVTATCNTIGKAGLLLFNEMKQRPVNMSKMNRMYADLKVSLRQLELEIEVTVVCMYIYMCISYCGCMGGCD